MSRLNGTQLRPACEIIDEENVLSASDDDDEDEDEDEDEDDDSDGWNEDDDEDDRRGFDMTEEWICGWIDGVNGWMMDGWTDGWILR